MAEYIEREAAYEKCGWYNMVNGKSVCAVRKDELAALPAADVAPVVRCKDCEHWGGVTFGNVCRRWSAPLAGMKNCTKPDDFCSYGGRRTEGR